jgi:hypothetical protein
MEARPEYTATSSPELSLQRVLHMPSVASPLWLAWAIIEDGTWMNTVRMLVRLRTCSFMREHSMLGTASPGNACRVSRRRLYRSSIACQPIAAEPYVQLLIDAGAASM